MSDAWSKAKTPDDECAFCGTPYVSHKAQEASGDMFHQWTNSSGELHEVRKTPAQPSTPSPAVVIAPAPDIVLRKLLRELGVITPEQYKGLFQGD
jgi:hypothetical protein